MCTCRQLCRYCRKPLDPLAPIDRASWAQDREAVLSYKGTLDEALRQVVRTHFYELRNEMFLQNPAEMSKVLDRRSEYLHWGERADMSA